MKREMGAILQCEQCDHESKAKSALKEHHKSLHNMVKQKCLNWGSQFLTKGNLRRHVESLHEGNVCGIEHAWPKNKGDSFNLKCEAPLFPRLTSTN